MSTGMLDGGAAVRGASRGFTVLLLGGVVQPWAARVHPVLGYWWLALIAVAAFTTAAVRAVRGAEVERLHWAQGAMAAVASYLLVLPLVLQVAGGFPWVQVVCTTGVAVVVGLTCQGIARRPTPQRGRVLPPRVEVAGAPRGGASSDSRHTGGRLDNSQGGAA